MKIFNWVHRRFYHKEGFGTGDVKKAAELITNDTDRKALLEHVTLADVVDSWRGGILAIGTFGFDPLKEFNRHDQKEYSITYKEMEEQCQLEECSVEDECDEIDLEDEELNPLVYTACTHGFEKNENGLHDDDDEDAPKPGLVMTIDGIPLSSISHQLGSNSNINLDSDKGKKKERITLADLFSADTDLPTKPHHGKVRPDFRKKPAPSGKNGLSFAKKLIPRVGEDARPIQKLHRLMTKMLKRKIHPDLEGKILKKDGQTKPTGLVPEEFGANESISLLPTQDAIV